MYAGNSDDNSKDKAYQMKRKGEYKVSIAMIFFSGMIWLTMII